MRICLTRSLINDRNELIPSFPEQGIAGFLEACVEVTDIPKISALVMLYDHVFGSAGIHPHSADSASEINLLSVERALNSKKIVAVGEIGLDYHYDFSPRGQAERCVCKAARYRNQRK